VNLQRWRKKGTSGQSTARTKVPESPSSWPFVSEARRGQDRRIQNTSLASTCHLTWGGKKKSGLTRETRFMMEAEKLMSGKLVCEFYLSLNYMGWHERNGWMVASESRGPPPGRPGMCKFKSSRKNTKRRSHSLRSSASGGRSGGTKPGATLGSTTKTIKAEQYSAYFGNPSLLK